jgi:hypothetical protein
MNNNEKFMEALERIDKLNNELRKIKNVIICIQEGQEVSEDFDDEIFMEDSDAFVIASSNLSRMMEHLLKLKYSTSTRFIRKWTNEIETGFRRIVQDRSGWYTKKSKTNVIKDLREGMQDIYDYGITFYIKDAKKFDNLKDGIKLIPKECPWTLDELMELDIDELLEKL